MCETIQSSNGIAAGFPGALGCGQGFHSISHLLFMNLLLEWCRRDVDDATSEIYASGRNIAEYEI